MTVTWPQMVDVSRLIHGRVTSAAIAESIPAVGRALEIYQLVATMDVQVYRGASRIPTPAILCRPDPDRPGVTWWLSQLVRDWLLDGNALGLVTARDAAGRPAACRWIPADRWQVDDPAGTGIVEGYWVDGVRVGDIHDVLHWRRGADRLAPGRGVGIVEQYVRSLDTATMQIDSEQQGLRTGGVPSVAVIAPGPLTQQEADTAGDQFTAMFSGPGRRPGVFPGGTTLTPLSWSAVDAEAIDARKMGLVDVANLTGIDGYWLGSAASSHTYRTPGPMWTTLLRLPLERMIRQLEDVLSTLLPYGQRVVMDRLDLTREDLASGITAMAAAAAARLMTYAEQREYLGLDPSVPQPAAPTPTPTPVMPAPTTDEAQDDTTEEDQS